MMKNFVSTLMIIVCAAYIAGTANASTYYYTEGHAHIGLVEDGSLELHFGAEGATINGVEDVDLECEAEDVVIVVSDAAATTSGGETTWVITQSHQEGVPFIGFGAHDAEGLYVDNEISVSLTAYSGPGEFSMYSTDSFGTATYYMSTEDGLGSDTYVLDLDNGDHAHLNMAFTEVGTYELTFTATAELVSGGTETSTATYTFEVVPEPMTMALLGLGGVLVRRRS